MRDSGIACSIVALPLFAGLAFLLVSCAALVYVVAAILNDIARMGM